ncbi:hypothetical protein IEQ34_015812 [Dendrobium chrysotoxum]|uniref:Uncharacterized protein n=1 Tax=Dendrobium chrysotoxum TaxID=161865 RepID=A0AAV7GIZ5_DENCH|nr:hypothetical protein IEQ34_015812 [Dendrobium chrysotoxum]
MDGALEIQQQLINLQQELTRAREERTQALKDLEKVRTKTRGFIEFHENEANKAKESERKMLESLVSQTKRLEQTKISLEESRNEIDSLHESIKFLSLGKELPDELDNLKKELKLALQGEEQSRKAMDVLALALIEVSNDSKQTKAKLRSTETALSFAEEKLQEAGEELQRLKKEADEEEAVFINCIKASENEMMEIREENRRLMEFNRTSREEIWKLRDILKQAVNEAIAVKEALEIARAENCSIKDLVREKDDALNGLKHEFESLKVSEAAATDSVKVLKALVAATSSMEQWRMVEKPVAVRRKQNSWGEMEGIEKIEGGDGSPLLRSEKEGKCVLFENRRLKLEDGKFEWGKEKKKKQFLRSFSDILRRKSFQR